MKLYVIRHGETDYNVARKMQGYQEIPLNDRGIAQAARVGERLAVANIDLILSSDLRRTVMTAAIVAARTGAPIRYDDALRERDPGALVEGSYDDAPGFFTDADYQPPGGEHMTVFNARIQRAFDAIGKTYEGRSHAMAIITHGFVCRAFVAMYFGANQSEAVGGTNASMTIAHYEQGTWRLETASCDAHLEKIVAPEIPVLVPGA